MPYCDMTQNDRIRTDLSYNPETGLFHWNRFSPGKRFDRLAGHIDSKGYVRIRCGDKLYSGQRLAWFLTHGYWSQYDIDHINGLPGDNRLVNLREATRAQNLQNQMVRNGTKGVTKHGERFRARITVETRRIALGVYDTREEAFEAYKKAAIQYFGAFARLD